MVTVTQGYSVTNGLTVGGGLDYTFTKDILKGALKIDYSHSWTTTYQAAMAYEVTEGYSGTVVTKPTVTRRTGRILKGCIGRQVSTVLSAFLVYIVDSNLALPITDFSGHLLGNFPRGRPAWRSDLGPG